MLQSLSGAHLGKSSFPEKSLKGGVVDQITMQIKSLIETGIEFSHKLNQAGLYLDRLQSRLNEELISQEVQLQGRIAHLQNVWQQQGAELTSTELPIFENHFQGIKQSLLDVIEILRTKKSAYPFFQIFRSSVEGKLLRSVGKLKGWIDSNQFSSIPTSIIIRKITKLVGKVLIFQSEVQQEVDRLQSQHLELKLRIVEIDVSIADRASVLLDRCAEGVFSLIGLDVEENSIQPVMSRVDRFFSIASDWQQTYLQSVKAFSDISQKDIGISEMMVYSDQQTNELGQKLHLKLIELLQILFDLKDDGPIELQKSVRRTSLSDQVRHQMTLFDREALEVSARTRRVVEQIKLQQSKMEVLMQKPIDRFMETILVEAERENNEKFPNIFEALKINSEKSCNFFASVQAEIGCIIGGKGDYSKVYEMMKCTLADTSEGVISAASIEDIEIKNMLLKTMIEQLLLTIASLKRVRDAQLEVVTISSSIDDSFLIESVSRVQCRQIILQAFDLAIKILEKDEQELEAINAAVKEINEQASSTEIPHL